MRKIKNMINLSIGLFLVAFSFNLFLSPLNLAAGGVSGLSLIIYNLFHLDESTFILIVNIILLIISYIFLGKEKTKKTILGSILFPLFIKITSYIVPLIHIKELEVIIIAVLGGILSGTGYGIVFKSGYTSGGTDILNQMMEKYMHIPISTSIIIIDGLITVSSGFIFGIENMIYSLISLLLISMFSNKKIIGEGESKTLYIYSKKTEEIKAYLHELKIDTTDFESMGGYTHQKGYVILTVVKNKDYYKIKEGIKLIDESAFLIVTNAYTLMNANITINNN